MARALVELDGHLRSLVRLRLAVRAGIADPEDPATYPEGDDDDAYLDRPTLFDVAQHAIPPARPEPSCLARLELRLRKARRRATVGLRHATRNAMPPEILETIADYAVGIDQIVDEICACGGPGGRCTLTWTAAAKTWLRCGLCGKVRYAATGLATVASSAAPAFVDNPHFHVDGSQATRHRLSRWHNFRTVVLDEWLEIGSASYALRCERLVHSTAAFGCLGGRGARHLNSSTDWIPGFQFETAALVATTIPESVIATQNLVVASGPANGSRDRVESRAPPTMSPRLERGVDVALHMDVERRSIAFVSFPNRFPARRGLRAFAAGDRRSPRRLRQNSRPTACPRRGSHVRTKPRRSLPPASPRPTFPHCRPTTP